MRNFLLVLGLLTLAACPKKSEQPADRPDAPPPPSDPPPSQPPPPAEDRAPAVAKDHPLYDRVEGTSFENACEGDGNCVASGCSGEICSAEQANSTCEFPEGGFPKGDACGCVSGQCIWYTRGAPAAGPKQGEPCPEGKCGAGLTCVAYYGVAGPKGPKLSSCEIPCADQKTPCPEGQTCVTIADGPGRVCRAAR
jgi:eight-cysteine-cluster-containing protein